MVIERLQLRMMPEPPGVAARHPHHMRQTSHLRRQVRRDTIWLQIMGIDNVAGALGVHLRRDASELGHKRTRHRQLVARRRRR